MRGSGLSVAFVRSETALGFVEANGEGGRITFGEIPSRISDQRNAIAATVVAPTAQPTASQRPRREPRALDATDRVFSGVRTVNSRADVTGSGTTAASAMPQVVQVTK